MSSDGAQMPVEAIMGADDMYDVVKFRVGISGKKVTALTLAAVAPAAGADVYLLPYSTQKDRSFTAGKVKEADKISGNYSYYTLDMRLKDKMVELSADDCGRAGLRPCAEVLRTRHGYHLLCH